MKYLVLILPPSDYVLQVEVYRRRRKTQALAGTTFPERLKPLFGRVGKNHKIVQAWWLFVVVMVVGVGSGSAG